MALQARGRRSEVFKETEMVMTLSCYFGNLSWAVNQPADMILEKPGTSQLHSGGEGPGQYQNLPCCQGMGAAGALVVQLTGL